MSSMLSLTILARRFASAKAPRDADAFDKALIKINREPWVDLVAEVDGAFGGPQGVWDALTGPTRDEAEVKCRKVFAGQMSSATMRVAFGTLMLVDIGQTELNGRELRMLSKTIARRAADTRFLRIMVGWRDQWTS